jgi:hypothetical protein
MAWLYLNNADKEILDQAIKEIDLPSDRATAIVAAAFVEDHLTTLLHQRMVKDAKTIREAFRAGGSLGDFGTKITLGYLNGFYSSVAYKELNTIQFIRNRFAHSISVNSFAIQHIKDRCNNLQLWREVVFKVAAPDRSIRPGSRLVVTIGRDLEDTEREISLLDVPSLMEPEDPRVRYVSACKFYIAAFAVLTNDLEFKLPEQFF